MATPDILAMSDHCRVAEWATRTRSSPPQTEAKEDPNGYRVDHHATIVKNRWLYPLMQRTADGGGFQILWEGFIDDEGAVWFATDSKPPSAPISERKDPREGASDKFIHFPMTDEKGYALSIRLLLTPFRLPSKTIKTIREPKYVERVTKTMPTLWRWDNGENEDASVHSRDGYYVKHERLWLEDKSTPTQVWVGSDPFAIAENRSNLYVRRRNAYAKTYEPVDPARRKEIGRIMLGQALRDSILRSPNARSRYGKSLDIGKMNREIGAFEKDRTKARLAFEKSARSLCEHLRASTFELLQTGSLEEEGYLDVEDAEFHIAALEHMRVLNQVFRALDKCEAGMTLLYDWAKESERRSDHFINRTILPQDKMPVHLFKTMRWTSKTGLKLLAEFAPRLGATRSNFLQVVTNGLVNLGIGDAAAVRAGIVTARINSVDLLGTLDLTRVPDEFFDTELIGKKVLRNLERHQHTDQSKLAEYKAKGLSRAALAVMALDAINVALAIKSLNDAKGPEATLRAGAGLATTSALFLTGVSKPLIDVFVKEGIGKNNALRGLHVANAFCGFVFATLNAYSARDALAQDDRDRAAALIVAAGAEVGSALVYMWMLAQPAAAAPPILLALSVVATAAYVAAVWLTDDPLEEFLEQCEWGSEPYDEADFHPVWALDKVGKWKGDYNLQSRIMLRVLSRLEISWDFKGWPRAEITINFRKHGMTLETSYVAEFADGTQSEHDKRTFDNDNFPKKGALKVTTNPKTPYVELSGIRRLFLGVKFKAHATATEETLYALLMDDGKGITSGKRSLLEK